MMLTGLRRLRNFEGTPEYSTSRLPDRSLVANASNSGGSEAQVRKAGARSLNSRRGRVLEVATRDNSQTVCQRKTQIGPGIVENVRPSKSSKLRGKVWENREEAYACWKAATSASTSRYGSDAWVRFVRREPRARCDLPYAARQALTWTCTGVDWTWTFGRRTHE